MFDVGFSELLVIGVIALVVIGPEDLPRVARTVGHVLGKMRRYVADVKAEIGQEMELAELRRLQSEVQASVQNFQADVEKQVREIDESLRDPLALEPEISVSEEKPTPKPLPEPIAPEPDPQTLTQADDDQLDLFGESQSTREGKGQT